ncbi:hypothetical protein D9615_006982 [Tricholomella constricta]|uniref:RNase H type-1 domain-containing protein n=1 Tax=Tricholomella constricta TaxID=117010 RepID=A0A8H5H9E2_9AGAR|nr:hypothetical protein D9615_006982 [Tricholomella constricta]
MATSARPPPKPPTGGASQQGTPNVPRQLPTRADISTFLIGDTGPVKSSKEARRWLETKGWILAGEAYDRTKLVRILLTAALNLSQKATETRTDAKNAVLAVAFLLEEDITDCIADALAEAVTAKALDRLDSATSKLTSSTAFSTATDTQQAETTIALKTVSTQLAGVTASLSDLAAKLNTTTPSPSSTLEQPSWADIARSSPGPAPPTAPSAAFNPSATEQHTRLQQRLLRGARTILVEANPDDDLAPTDRSPAGTYAVRLAMNKQLEELDRALEGNSYITEEGESAPAESQTYIRGLAALDRGAYLFEMSTTDAARRFREYATDPTLAFLKSHLGASARIKAKAYNLVFRFVPCGSFFDPSDRDHLNVIEDDNDLPSGAILSASWLKRPDRRSPKQTVASLKVVCSTAEAANRLLQERIFVAGHLVVIRKDLKEPIRCNKCQRYGHIWASCKSPERCAACASPDHATTECPPNPTPRCPIFKKQCDDLESRLPENSMPYFPTGEAWTWSPAPPKLSKATPAHQPRIDHALPRPPAPPTASQSTEAPPRPVTLLKSIIQDTIASDDLVPMKKPCPFSKRWWCPELNEFKHPRSHASNETYKYRDIIDHPSKAEYQRLSRAMSDRIEEKRREHWIDWLENIDARQIYTANKYVVNEPTDFSCDRVPDLKTTVDGTPRLASTNSDKAEALADNPDGTTTLQIVETTSAYKYLGVVFDPKLRWTAHYQKVIASSAWWSFQVARLSKISGGMPPHRIRQLYNTVAVPAFTYAADVWYTGIHNSPSGKKRVGSVAVTKKLTPVQRHAAKLVTGSLSTTAGDVLDAHTNLLPVDLLYHKILQRAAVRLASLPDTHPLHSPVRKAAKRYVKRHRSPLHSLFFLTGIDPSLVETVSSTRRRPNYAPSFSTHIEDSKETALVEANRIFRLAPTSVHCDGSGYEGGVGASAVLFVNGLEKASLKYHLGPITKHTVYEAEIVGLTLGLHLLTSTSRNLRSITAIGSDSQAAIKALGNQRPHPAHYLLDYVHTAAEKLHVKQDRIARASERRTALRRGNKWTDRTRKVINLQIHWTPGHVDFGPNERADELAKIAATGTSSPAPDLHQENPTCENRHSGRQFSKFLVNRRQ